MLKRYIVLTLAFSFMAISIPKCPFVTKKSSGAPTLTQGPAAVNQAAVTVAGPNSL